MISSHESKPVVGKIAVSQLGRIVYLVQRFGNCSGRHPVLLDEINEREELAKYYLARHRVKTGLAVVGLNVKLPI